MRKLIERAFKEAEKGSVGFFKQIHRLIEEDSISTQTRVALTAEASNGKEACPHCGRGPKMSTEHLLETLRAIYSIGAKEAPNKYGGPEDGVLDVAASSRNETAAGALAPEKLSL